MDRMVSGHRPDAKAFFFLEQVLYRHRCDLAAYYAMQHLLSFSF